MPVMTLYLGMSLQEFRKNRPVGSGMSDEKLLEKYPEIVKYLKKGLSVRDTAAASHKSTYTVQKVKKAMKLL